MVPCSYEPLHSVQQLERFTPNPNALIDPEYPQWQTLALEGGQKVTHIKGKHKQDTEEPGVHAEVTVPFPMLLNAPPAGNTTAPLPTVPFRLRFHSSLPHQFPLLTFASPQTSDWQIRFIRLNTLRIHHKEFVRTLLLRAVWKSDAGDQQATLDRQISQLVDPVAIHPTEPQDRVSEEAFTATATVFPPMFEETDAEASAIATPPPEFAETYASASDPFDPFPPIVATEDGEENIYIRGQASLCRSMFRHIFAPIRTPDILVEYFLEFEITPKGGSVKETFAPLKVRCPVMFEKV